jgi:hypothetical protein
MTGEIEDSQSLIAVYIAPHGWLIVVALLGNAIASK